MVLMINKGGGQRKTHRAIWKPITTQQRLVVDPRMTVWHLGNDGNAI